MWTIEDQEKGWCAPEDVGQPKIDHERWTLLEVEALGLPGYLLGTVKPPSAWTVAPTTSSPLDATTPDMAEGLAQAYAKMGGDVGFTEWASKNPGLVYPQMIKMGIALTAKTAPPALPDLDELSDEQIEGMSSSDLKRILLKSVGITKKSQI